MPSLLHSETVKPPFEDNSLEEFWTLCDVIFSCAILDSPFSDELTHARREVDRFGIAP